MAASLQGKDPVMASATPSVEIISHEIAPKEKEKGGFRELEAWETWKEPPVLSSPRQAPPKLAGPQRVPRELRKKSMTPAERNCNCKGGHQLIEGAVPAPPGLQAEGQDGEWEVKVSKENRQDGRVEIKEGAASKRVVENEIANLGESLKGLQSRGRDPKHHYTGMRSKQGPDEREEGDAGWQPSGV